MAKRAQHARMDAKAATSSRGRSPLVEAAAALESEVERFDELAATLRRMPLNSKKNLERAARALQEASGYDERIGGHLRTLLEAVNAANERLRASAASIAEHAQAIGERDREYGEMLGRFAALGEEARQINALSQEVVAAHPATADAEVRLRIGARLDELMERMARVIDEAADVARAAAAQDMSDLAREAATLKQQMAAVRNKLGPFRQHLAARGG